ncbi:MAG: putative sugar nucleotidyl transferase [Planctomycetota bacterium]
MQIICFEDDHIQDLCPVVHARPAYGITCASYQLIDWLRPLSGELSGHVRDYLQLIQKLDFGLEQATAIEADEAVLLVNARLVPSVANGDTLKQIAQSDHSEVLLAEDGQTVLAAKLSASDRSDHRSEGSGSDDGCSHKSTTDIDAIIGSAVLLAEAFPSSRSLDVFRRPHDIVRHQMACMADSMQWRIQHGDYTQLSDGVFVGSDVSIGDYASIHVDDGPIVLESNVKVGPFCFLEGPLYAGHSTRVIEHSAIKDGVSLGHTVKIGGEVEASVIEPFTNKQHHGFLGHSYLGSWINLGAGTCNSDLKNTYGKINIQYGEEKVATGMQFLGCIMGDYSKSAINTGIFTGKVIGVCTMMYGFVTSNVPSFVNYARLFGQTSLLPADVMINTQARMFARRSVQQRECDMQLIRDMYDLTVQERDTAEPMGY